MFPNELYLADSNISQQILTHYANSHFQKTQIDQKSPLAQSFLNDSQRNPRERRLFTKKLRICDDYIDLFKQSTQQLIHRWKSTRNSIVNITDECTHLATQIIQQTLTHSNHLFDENNLKLFLSAGSETSSTTLSLALLTLAHRQDIQNELRQHDSSFDSFLNEIIRFWCIAPLIARQCTHPISFQQLSIPRHTNVNIFTWAIHRLESNQFDCYSTMKDASLSFSKGSRMCPGKEFAINELKIVLSTLIRSIHFEPITNSSLDSNEIFRQQLFDIDWQHSVLHTKQDIFLKINFLS